MSSTSNPTNPGYEPKAVSHAVRKALLGELPVELRGVHVEVLSETLRTGVPVRPAALAVVLATHYDLTDTPLTFTAAHVQELLWCGLSEFCEDYSLILPEGCTEALHALMSIGVETRLLDTGTDSLGDVFAAFRELTAC